MATVYLELEGRYISENSTVEVFGEFSYPATWKIKVPCTFDPMFKCFKADILIQTGESFKFIIDKGRRYAVSNRYNNKIDRYGNENNMWDPKKIIRTTEKKYIKSKRFQDTHNIEEINSIQETNSESYNEGDFFSFPNMPSNQNY
jgi:hypothetical protein